MKKKIYKYAEKKAFPFRVNWTFKLVGNFDALLKSMHLLKVYCKNWNSSEMKGYFWQKE